MYRFNKIKVTNLHKNSKCYNHAFTYRFSPDVVLRPFRKFETVSIRSASNTLYSGLVEHSNLSEVHSAIFATVQKSTRVA